MKKIVISNYNIVSAAGIGIESFTKNILTKNKFSDEIKLFDVSKFDSNKGFILNDLDFTEHLGKTGLKHINRNAKLSYLCIENILKNEYEKYNSDEKPGFILGTAFGSVESICEFWKTQIIEGNSALRPLDFPNTVINAASSFVNIRYQLSNVSATISTGFNSSLDAFIYAYDFIQNGYGDYLLVGGSEELGECLYLGLDKSNVLSKIGNILPFSKNRDGVVPGEGAAIFVVESEEHAKKRNAVIIAEICGFSSRFGDEEKIKVTAYNEALSNACLKHGDIDMISSSANGGKNDEKILNIYKNVFANELNNISIVVHKQYFGECYGASGALQIASCLSNCLSGKISPLNSDNLIDNLPSFSKDVVNKKIKYFIVDGLSCEGNCTVLVFKNVIDK